MKNVQRIMPFLLGAALLLSGCASAFEKEYSYSAPFSYNSDYSGGDATEISNINMLKSALLDLIGHHEETGALRFTHYNGSVADDLAEACLEVRTENPLGAYAVETLNCDTSRIVSYYTADIQISYKRTAEEIRNVISLASVQELNIRLLYLLTSYAPGAALRLNSGRVDEAYITSHVRAYHFSNPVSIITAPAAEVEVYPPEGLNRIYDIHLDYGAPAEQLREMTAAAAARVTALTGDLAAPSQPRLALECADRLFALLTAGSGSFPSTAYGALVEGYADSKGVALAYKALCDAAGIECLVVQGTIGSMGADERYWNIIGLEGEHYHVDVSAFGWGDRPAAFLLDDASLWGIYLWDTELYPPCRGSLRFYDVAPEEAPVETPVPTRRPQSSASPQPTDVPGTVYDPAPPTQPPETEGPTEFIPRVTEPPVETPVPTPSEEPVPTEAPAEPEQTEPA